MSILAILEFLVGILFLFFSGLGLANSTFLEGGFTVYGHAIALVGAEVWIAGAVVILFGLLAMVLGYGMWSGKGWSWTLAVAFFGLGSVFSSFGIVFGDYSYVGSLVFCVLILWYLLRSHVKGYFGRRSQSFHRIPQGEYP